MKWQSYIKEFQNYLKIERGLSQNTVNNYTLDLEKLLIFLNQFEQVPSPLKIQKEIIQQFIYQVLSQLNARSQARIISGMRSFFNFLVFEDYRQDSPMELIELPKIGRKLPDTLAVEEIDALIAAIDLSKDEGQRNKAILETLYGCGLRVSELVDLKISDLFFEEGFVKVTGKGNKQRFVPIGNFTQKYITIYMKEKEYINPLKKVLKMFFF